MLVCFLFVGVFWRLTVIFPCPSGDLQGARREVTRLKYYVNIETGAKAKLLGER